MRDGYWVPTTVLYYCRTGFGSDDLTASKMATKTDHYCWISLQKLHPLYLIQELSSHLWNRYHFLFLDEFEGIANISVAVKSVLQ